MLMIFRFPILRKGAIFVNEINIPFESHSVENDFIVEFNNVKLTDKVLIFCKGKDIEIDSSRAINEDLDGIISDLKVDTEIKVKLADIPNIIKEYRDKEME